MDDAIGDLLKLRGVELSKAESVTESFGFRCLGIAEKIPELQSGNSSSVYVWHISKGILPVSVAEAERWLVDVPRGAHWVLSEREFQEQASKLLYSELKIELWSPKKLSQWIGEAVLSGELTAHAALFPSTEKTTEDEEKYASAENLIILQAKINLDEWSIQRGIEYLDAKPILLQARIWNIVGALVSPDGKREEGEWRVLEDPWADRLELYNSESRLQNPLNLRIINSQDNKLLSESDLRVMLVGILETRKQRKKQTSEGTSVTSTMLERWSFDSEGAHLESLPAAIPGWILDYDGRKEILHSRNGRTYDLSSFEAP